MTTQEHPFDKLTEAEDLLRYDVLLDRARRFFTDALGDRAFYAITVERFSAAEVVPNGCYWLATVNGTPLLPVFGRTRSGALMWLLSYAVKMIETSGPIDSPAVAKLRWDLGYIEGASLMDVDLSYCNQRFLYESPSITDVLEIAKAVRLLVKREWPGENLDKITSLISDYETRLARREISINDWLTAKSLVGKSREIIGG